MMLNTTSGTATPTRSFVQGSIPLSRCSFVADPDSDFTDEVLISDVAEAGVVEAGFVTAVDGPNSPLRNCCTSVGRAVNHDGVLSFRNSDHSNRDTAGTLVSASARIDEGTPVGRTSPKDALNGT